MLVPCGELGIAVVEVPSVEERAEEGRGEDVALAGAEEGDGAGLVRADASEDRALEAADAMEDAAAEAWEAMEDTALGIADGAEDGIVTEGRVAVLAEPEADGVMTNVGSCDGVTNDDRTVVALEAGEAGIPGV
jgi:hypothetical protein